MLIPNFLLLFFASVISPSLAAERVEVKRLLQNSLRDARVAMTSDSMTSGRMKRDAEKVPMTAMDDVLSLDSDTTLDVVKTTTTVQGTKLVKLQEKYKGLTLPDGVVTLETDPDGEHVLDASGAVYRNINLDLGRPDDLSEEDAITVCVIHHQDKGRQAVIRNMAVERDILFDADLSPYPAYLVHYLILSQGDERRPYCVVNGRTGQVNASWDGLATCSGCRAKGVGGNVKIGKIRYNDLMRCLDVRRENGMCYLDNEHVQVINNNFTWDEVKETASYDCLHIDDEVNGGYSPMLDALFYGTALARMFRDWYGINPLGDIKLRFRLHVGFDIGNAIWSGSECMLGDGDEESFPLVSMDIVAHEVCHGLTERNAGLHYYQQSGAINEAFSDMAGETAETYLGEADWLYGVEVVKEGMPPIRDLAVPENDNKSIAHASDFVDYMNVHYASGVYNRAFYLLVHDYGLPIRHAFHVFLLANQMYWHHMSDFDSAACDVMKAAYDLGQDGALFRRAFREVGVAVCDVSDHVLGLRNGEPRGNVTVSSHASPSFVFRVPGQFASHVHVTATSRHGNVTIMLSNATWGQDEEGVEVYGKGVNSLRVAVPERSALYFGVTLSSPTSLTDVTVTAQFVCVRDFPYVHEDVVQRTLYQQWRFKCQLFAGEEEEEGEGGDQDAQA